MDQGIDPCGTFALAPAERRAKGGAPSHRQLNLFAATRVWPAIKLCFCIQNAANRRPGVWQFLVIQLRFSGKGRSVFFCPSLAETLRDRAGRLWLWLWLVVVFRYRLRLGPVISLLITFQFHEAFYGSKRVLPLRGGSAGALEPRYPNVGGKNSVAN